MKTCDWCGRPVEDYLTYCSPKCIRQAEQAERAMVKASVQAAPQPAPQQPSPPLTKSERIRAKIQELENSVVQPTFRDWMTKKFPLYAILPDTNPNRGWFKSQGAKSTWMLMTLVMLFAGCAGVITMGQNNVLLGLVCSLASLLYFVLLLSLVPCYVIFLNNRESMKKDINRDIFDEIDHLREKLAVLRKKD
jgi:hypothetical protein